MFIVAPVGVEYGVKDGSWMRRRLERDLKGNIVQSLTKKYVCALTWDDEKITESTRSVNP